MLRCWNDESKSVVHKIAIKMNTTEVIDSAINILAQNIVISNLIITVLGFPAHKSVCWIVDTPMTNFWNFDTQTRFFQVSLNLNAFVGVRTCHRKIKLLSLYYEWLPQQNWICYHISGVVPFPGNIRQLWIKCWSTWNHEINKYHSIFSMPHKDFIDTDTRYKNQS